MRRFTATALAVAILGGLNACGGGSTADPPPAATNGARLTGFAIKGIIRNGLIDVFGVDTAGRVQSRPLVTGIRTADDGSYATSIPANYTGPLLVVVTSDASTTMVCDAVSGCGPGVDFGESYAPGAGLELRAAVPRVAPNQAVSVNLTPLTHIAAVLAAGDAILGETEADLALTRVATQFGLDAPLLSTRPVDITDPQRPAGMSDPAFEDALKHALLGAGIAEAAATDASRDLQQTLAEYAQAFSARQGLPPQARPGAASLENLLESATAVANSLDALLAGNPNLATIAPGLGNARIELGAELADARRGSSPPPLPDGTWDEFDWDAFKWSSANCPALA